MSITDGAILAVGLYVGFVVFGALRDLPRINQQISLLQASLTSAAIVVAGVWYFVERQALPRADITQTVHVIPIETGLIAVEAHLTIKNVGRRLLAIRKVKSRVQGIVAQPFGYDQLADLSNDHYWNATRPNSSMQTNQFHFAELRWPMLRNFEGEVIHDVEAGESDVFVATFIMRCPPYDFVRVATEIYNPADVTGEIAWKARTFANVGQVCRPKTSKEGR